MPDNGEMSDLATESRLLVVLSKATRPAIVVGVRTKHGHYEHAPGTILAFPFRTGVPVVLESASIAIGSQAPLSRSGVWTRHYAGFRHVCGQCQILGTDMHLMSHRICTNCTR